MNSILKAIETAKSNNPFFADTITELSKNKVHLIPSESTYIEKMSGMSFGTVTNCLGQIEHFKEDKSRSEYETLDKVIYSLKNFALNKLRANITYPYWQDCWSEFSKELTKV